MIEPPSKLPEKEINVYLLSHFSFRSSSTTREKPSSKLPVRRQACFICGKQQSGGEVAKCRISERPRAQSLIDAASFLMDEVYTRIIYLKSCNDVFSADLRYHKNCFNKCIFNYDQARQTTSTTESAQETSSDRYHFNNYTDFLSQIIEQGRGFTLPEVHDLIKEKEGVEIHNGRIKLFHSRVLWRKNSILSS